MQSVHQTAPVPSGVFTTRESLRERCDMFVRCLPQAPMRDMLARLFEDLLAHQWQPIESAPKDGTLVAVAGWSGYLGRWTLYTSYWRKYRCDGEGFAWIGHAPTHWMPLPDAPHHRSADTERHGSNKPESDSEPDSEPDSGFAALRAVPHQPTGERE